MACRWIISFHGRRLEMADFALSFAVEMKSKEEPGGAVGIVPYVVIFFLLFLLLLLLLLGVV